MKLVFLLPALFLASMAACAQHDSWKIKLNHRTILSTQRESSAKNIRRIQSAEWNKNGFLEIGYKESAPGKWIRSFLFFDEQDQELFRKDSVNILRIPLVDLRRMAAGKKSILIYTVVAPRDPGTAIRVRRVHLCTLRLP